MWQPAATLYFLKGGKITLLFDIHSHILPGIDDGAVDSSESLKLLNLMKEQGITDVIATPHFYPADNNLDDFMATSQKAYKKITEISVKRELPNIYLGCELLYFKGISKSEAISKFCLGNSNYLLLELTDSCINETLFEEILQIRENFRITPIIAHVERYCGAKKYKKFIKFLISHNVPIQINADSVLITPMGRVIKKLIKSPLFCVIASDAHSVEQRPPKLAEALNAIAKSQGEQYKDRLIRNSEFLYTKITGK